MSSQYSPHSPPSTACTHPVLCRLDDAPIGEQVKHKRLVKDEKDDELDGQKLGQWSPSLQVVFDECVEDNEAVESDGDAEKVNGKQVHVGVLVAQIRDAVDLVVLGDDAGNRQRRSNEDILDHRPLE